MVMNLDLNQLTVSKLGFAMLAFMLLAVSLPSSADDKDHPLLARYDGASIYDSTSIKFVEYPIALSPIGSDSKLASRYISGKYSHINYQIPGEEGVTLVLQSYLQSLKKKGFSVVFKCKRGSCGGDLADKLFRGTSLFSEYLNVVGEFDERMPDDYAYIVANSKTEKQNIYVVLLFRQAMGINADIELMQDIVQVDELKAKSIDVNLDFDAGIRSSGKVILDGLFFDHDGTELKQSSNKALQKIADYLKSTQNSHFYVVGHTDSVGKYDYNLQLSKARADSVVKALTEQYKIKNGRLTAIGVGPVSPISTNQLESGRALNRRVELVLK